MSGRTRSSRSIAVGRRDGDSAGRAVAAASVAVKNPTNMPPITTRKDEVSETPLSDEALRPVKGTGGQGAGGVYSWRK